MMEQKSCLITNSGINRSTGGGTVGFNLMESLMECTDLTRILSTDAGTAYVPEPDHYSINACHYGYNKDQPWLNPPFLMDYFAETFLPDDSDLFVFYGDPFLHTAQKLRDKYTCKMVADLAPHSIKLSQEEHIANGATYPFPHLTDPALWKIYSGHLKLADVVIVHSKISAEYIKKQAELKQDPVVIPHGCYPSNTTPPLPEMFTPGYFGAMGYDKGVQHLLKAWLGFPLSEKTQLQLGGSKGINFNPDIQRFFKVYDFLPDIGDFWKNVSVGVFPSVTEGFNIPCLEAMSYGRPIITTPATGPSELIQDGKEGFIIPIRDPKAIREKLIYFIDNPSEIKRMGAEARKTATNYSWSTIQEAYIAIYKELLHL